MLRERIAHLELLRHELRLQSHKLLLLHSLLIVELLFLNRLARHCEWRPLTHHRVLKHNLLGTGLCRCLRCILVMWNCAYLQLLLLAPLTTCNVLVTWQIHE